MTDVFSKQIAIEIEDGRKLAKVPLGKIGEHGWASLWACLQSRPSSVRAVCPLCANSGHFRNKLSAKRKTAARRSFRIPGGFVPNAVYFDLVVVSSLSVFDPVVLRPGA